MESLWDEVLPAGVRELPDDLAGLDRVLSDPALLGPIGRAWGGSGVGYGRPSIAMATFVRLMVVKQRTGWGYEVLVREVSDSLHLRRFCLIAIDQRVPDESTIRKLCRRLGAPVVEEITRLVWKRRSASRASAAVLFESTRRWWRRMSATRPTRYWRCRVCERWPGRAESSPQCSSTRRCGCGIDPAR